jgi:AmmeMemoRadiSam system protein A/AmmeMemoRadiSam system protein B
VSVFTGQGFRTPLGIAEIDRKIASALLAADDDCVSDQEVHAAEHSIEVEVPFVQVLFPRARIVPVVVASSERAISARLGEALAAVVKDRKALIVASSDLSHYPSAADAEVVDREVLDAMASLDPARLRSTIEAAMGRHVPDLVTCACGEAPVLAAMEAARRLGAKGGSVISYANSGQTAFGGASHVVGYGAVAFGADAAPMKTKGEMKEPPYSDTFSQAERDALLAFARESISRAVTTQTAPLARGFDDNLRQRRGVFVTLKKGGELRGCIGHTEPDVPLCRLVGAMAISAALQDPRFPPVAPGEVPGLEIEISVLTRLTEGRRADDIVIGKDGVVLSKGGKSALFLPQVAVEQHWDRPTMLDNLCQKAGMDRLCWREGARFATFQAIVFGEDAHRGR